MRGRVARHAWATRVPARRGAFTLVEVLIAVLVLALGLLGLGAVIPTVIREQKLATDATMGVVVANEAEAFLRAHPNLNVLECPGSFSTDWGWGRWLLDDDWSEPPDDPDEPGYLWVAPLSARDAVDYDPDTGDFMVGGFGGKPCADHPMGIPVRQRLWPSDAAVGVDPQYVWDIAARRYEGDAANGPYTVQIALFVRRIDPRIRVPEGKTLRKVLTGDDLDRPSDRRVAVGWSTAGDRAFYPTFDGTNGNGAFRAGWQAYARPIALAIDTDPATPNMLVIPAKGGRTPLYQLIQQAGQKLVDDFGNVYTVQRVERVKGDLRTRLVVEPSVAPDATMVLFTPQIPVSVSVFNISVQEPE